MLSTNRTQCLQVSRIRTFSLKRSEELGQRIKLLRPWNLSRPIALLASGSTGTEFVWSESGAPSLPPITERLPLDGQICAKYGRLSESLPFLHFQIARMNSSGSITRDGKIPEMFLVRKIFAIRHTALKTPEKPPTVSRGFDP